MLEDTEDATSKHALLWTCRVKAQRAQKSALHEIKEAKCFDVVKHNMLNRSMMHPKQINDNSKYYGTGHPLAVCPACTKKYGGCRKMNHFKAVCRLMWQQYHDWHGRKMIHDASH